MQELVNFIKKILQLFLTKNNLYKEGIGVLICAKDEEYNIKYCIESIIDFSSQIVCVDHNSDDGTLEVMLDCQKQYADRCDFIVIHNEGEHLKDARNQGLNRINRKWLLNIGGDFVFYNKGENKFSTLVSEIINKKVFSATRFGFVNLYGDLHHTYKQKNKQFVVGENYLLKMLPQLTFKEQGKFDYLSFPKYYVLNTINKPVFFHLSGLKSDKRLIYRNCYFEWKEMLNNELEKGNKQKLSNFKLFSSLWEEELFDTNNEQLLKNRFQKQMCSLHLEKYNEQNLFLYPSVIKRLIDDGNERFIIKYENEQASFRIDKKDQNMKHFLDSETDLEWSADEYFEKYKRKQYLISIKNKILEK